VAPTGFFASILALDNRFWIVNVMEMIERLAYYGVRTVVPIYMVLASSEGGIELTHAQKGTIFAWWAFVQSMLPMYTGGLADRYGHKNTIALAVVLKIIGYLMMAWLTDYYAFMAGALLLAAGTAIFKPGVQGTLAATMPKNHAAIGWGIFYQLVNVGGFIGPVLAGVLRLMDWQFVFLSCAVIVALNFAWLPFYTSPTEERRAGRAADGGKADDAATQATWTALSRSVGAGATWFWLVFWTLVNIALSIGWWVGLVGLSADDYVLLTTMFGIYQLAFYVYAPLKRGRFDAGRGLLARDSSADPLSVVVLSTVGMFQARVFFFCLVFAGFWVMFNQFFDLLPNVIDDWVDSSDVVATLGAAFAWPAVPIGLGLLFALLMGALCGLGVVLPMRPDRRPAAEVPLGSYVVLALTFTAVLVPLAGWVGSATAAALGPVAGSSDGGAAVASLGVGLVTVTALASLIVGAVVLAGVALATRVGAWPMAIGAAVVGTITWATLSVPYLQGSASELLAFARAGGQVNPEWLVNLNPGLIVFTMVFFAWVSSFFRPLTSITIGMVIATAGAVLAGVASIGWVVLAGIFVFSVGEMLSSPKKMEYLASLSAKGQEGLFMGYANVPVAIGWIAGSLFAGNRYEQVGDKVNLARRHLVEQVGLPADAVENLDKADVLPRLAAELGSTPLEAQRLLFELYDPWWVWVEIGAIGVVSIVGMIAYDRVLRAIDARAAA
jgi:MFS family permease